MNLIFVTRKIDKGDSATSFVFSWIEKLAAEVETLYVICQEKGEASGLPANVEVHSFGKERGYGRVHQGFLLLVTCFKLARRADGFFIHMHPIYAIMAWMPARFFGKKIVLWYTHKSMDLKLSIAHSLIDVVLTASKESFRLPSVKVVVAGHGIDMKKFKVQSSKPKIGENKYRILSIGRISPVKDYETLIKAVDILVKEKQISDLDIQIYGNIIFSKDKKYLDTLIKFVENAGLDEVVDFQAGVAHEYVPGLLAESDLLVNLSETGSLDKNVLEAAACGVLVLSSNEAFFEPLKRISGDLIFERNNPRQLAEKIMKLKAMPEQEEAELSAKLRAWVEKEHNLDNLVQRIVESFR